jgi:hypothetical protein
MYESGTYIKEAETSRQAKCIVGKVYGIETKQSENGG